MMPNVQRRRSKLIGLALTLVLSTVLLAQSLPSTAATPWYDKGSPFGVVAALGNRVRAEDVGAAVALMREAGVQWQREEIFWDRVQKEPGGPFTWNSDGSGFYDYDRTIGAQVAAGINILGLLDYNPAWFKGRNPHPDEWIKDWGDFVYAAVAHYGRDRGWIKHWELWNEPNLAQSGYESGLYEIKDFVRILEVGRAAAKAADPEARIVMGGLASGWTLNPSPYTYDYLDYLERAAQIGALNHVDIVAIHPYRPNAPEGDFWQRDRSADFRSELQRLDELLLQYGPKPVWITEMGWTTSQTWPGVDADTQALFLIRAYMFALTHPNIEKIFWYDFRNDTRSGSDYERPIYNDGETEFHFGLLRRSYPLDPNRADLRKPSFLAYRTMTHLLGGLAPQQILADGDWNGQSDIYWYRFGDGTRRVDVLWRAGEANPVLPVACDCREALVRSWRGEVQYVLQADSGMLNLRLEAMGTPIYIEYDPPINLGGQFFAATNHSLRGAFQSYWYANGGLERFGYPLTDELIEPEAGHGRPRVVQYFERARFEHFPEFSNTEFEVQFGRLGDTILSRQGINWHTMPKVSGVSPECLFFAETGHSLCPPFRNSWEQLGGLTKMGFPLTEPFEMSHPETGRNYTVQYFERARLEYFPEHQGTSNEVQLGLLGRELIWRWGGMP
jgi:hypothetical protein